MKNLLLYISSIILFISCKKNETITPTTPPVVVPTLSVAFTSKVLEKGTVEFTNSSVSAESYEWDFGDNVGKSTEKTPKYTYKYNGTYKVKLKAYSKTSNAEFTQDVVVNTTINEPAPVITDQSVDEAIKYIILEKSDGGLAALDTDGKVKWTFIPPNGNKHLVASPKVFDNKIIANFRSEVNYSSGDIYILDINTGSVIKKYTFNSVADFHIHQNILIVSSSYGLQGFDLATEKTIWKQFENSTGIGIILGEITVNNGSYFIYNNDTKNNSYSLIAGDIKTGKINWESKYTKYLAANEVMPKPISKNGKVYFVGPNDFQVFDEKTGNELWKTAKSGQYYRGATVRNDTLYWAQQNSLTAFNGNSGKVLWEQNNIPTGSNYNDPFVYKNILYLNRGSYRVSKVNIKTGTGLSPNGEPDNVSHTVISGEYALFTSGANVLFYSLAESKKIWETKTTYSLSVFRPFIITQSGKAIYPN